MKRRTFLQFAGAGALGLGAWSPRALPAATPGAGAVAVSAGRNWTWTRVADDLSDTDIAAHFARIRAAGIEAVLLGGAKERSARIARAEGLEIHAWMWTLCRSDEDLMRDHPDWYAVNRLGASTHDEPPYVGYYRFMCPSRSEVRRWLARRVADLAEQPWLDGVHLDYVRYPDVILPRALWEKYDLVQHEELPDFDYCYCDVCRAAFREQAGRDPLELADAPADEAWRRYRWDSVTRLVNELVDVVHSRGKSITAAVFPSPTIARRLVRQDWARWRLDAVLPMVYHSFYEEDVDWIEGTVAEGVAALPEERPLYAGLYLPALEDEADVRRAVAAARDGGAAGVALFGGVRDLVDIPRGK